MKIVHILHELKFSGAEIMYVDAAPVFQKKGCDLMVVASAPQIGEFAPYFERAGYKVFHIPFPRLKNYIGRIKYYRRFIKFIKKENVDVVHIHSHSSMWGMALCAWISGKKSVKTFHAIFPTSWYSYFYHCLLRWSAKKIFKCKFQSIGHSVHDHELKLYGNKTIKINNWYGSNRFYPAQSGEKAQLRKELNIPDNAFVLITIGGCDHNKRHHDLIKALPLLIDKIPNLLYLHLGRGETEEEEKKLSVDLGVAEYIRFCGNQRDVRKYLIASDIYIMISRFEGLSITTIEAMACGTPSLLYNVPGLRDFNSEGENSLLIEPNYKILAEKTFYLYNHPEIRMRIAGNAKKMVDEWYNMEKNASKVFELYL
ncbi:MAG: glycosyltransferase family 4 protein [Dysgonamonadaceae bacterium]|nr:glycosyltransferase family 4 protein [Dysgonamonadaceae bacterium]MDD4728946.1 glycosyltransferase family 4 protein [Dysgonamonadaceae bacterium]